MNVRETYMVILLLGGIFLLQIWVADAETRLTQQLAISDFSIPVLQATNKMINDDSLRKQIGLEPLPQGAVSKKTDTTLKVQKTVHSEKEKSEFVWYKPWTWSK